jgi:hypothetical protein
MSILIASSSVDKDGVIVDPVVDKGVDIDVVL